MRAFFMICLAVAGAARTQAESKCHLGKLVEMTVTMSGMQPLVDAKVDGQPVTFILDSGAYFSHITPASAAEHKLQLTPLPDELQGLMETGVGGSSVPKLATVHDFSFANVSLHKVQFSVVPGDLGHIGVLGQNVLALDDAEYDLGHGVVRLFRTHDCESSNLAYWVQPGAAYSVLPTDRNQPILPQIIAQVSVNGLLMTAIFDTGAGTSMMTLKAAARVGLQPGGAGVIEAGEAHGFGPRSVKTWIGKVASLQIGEEEVRNARIRIGGELPNADILLGADFFLSHHLYWAQKAHKLFITFNGGHVFDLRKLQGTEERRQN